MYHLPPRESETLESAHESDKVICLVLVHLQKGVGSHSLMGEVCTIKVRSYSKRNKDASKGGFRFVNKCCMFEPHKNVFFKIPV